FSKSAVWINGYGYESTSSDNCPVYVGVNPYDYIVNYNSKAAPRIGASVTVALSIYYDCATVGNEYANCLSCDVKYQTYYQ
ncbi:15471_t:CDS:1, partial [Funneliformis geosporum]